MRPTTLGGLFWRDFDAIPPSRRTSYSWSCVNAGLILPSEVFSAPLPAGELAPVKKAPQFTAGNAPGTKAPIYNQQRTGSAIRTSSPHVTHQRPPRRNRCPTRQKPRQSNRRLPTSTNHAILTKQLNQLCALKNHAETTMSRRRRIPNGSTTPRCTKKRLAIAQAVDPRVTAQVAAAG